MKFKTLSFFAALALWAPSADAGTLKPEDWFTGALAIRDDRDQELKLNVGAGAFYAPDGSGSEDYKLFPFPLVDAEYRDQFFISTARGIGVNALRRGNTKAGFRLTVDYGRDASASTRTKTLKDVDPAPEAGVFLESYGGPFRFKLDMRQAIGGHEGIVGGLDIARALRLADDIVVLVGGKLTAANSTYMNSFYGVPRGNTQLKAYSADSGLHDIAGYLAILYQLDRSWYLSYDIRYSQLLGPAADSPVSAKAGQAFAGLTIGYRF